MQAFLQHFIFLSRCFYSVGGLLPIAFWQEIEQPFFFGTEYILLLREREGKKWSVYVLKFYDEFLFKDQFRSRKMEEGVKFHIAH